MNAAMRVNTPRVIARPVTNSISPAHQNGHVPTGMEVPSGQPNNFIEPRNVNSNPKMIRKALRAGDE
jgi:hypothetical protein